MKIIVNIRWLMSVVLVRLVKVLVVGVDPGAALDVLPVPLKVLVLLGSELVDLKMAISLGGRLSDPHFQSTNRWFPDCVSTASCLPYPITLP